MDTKTGYAAFSEMFAKRELVSENEVYGLLYRANDIPNWSFRLI